MRITPLALAAGLLANGAAAWGQGATPPAVPASAAAPASAASAASAAGGLQASERLRSLPRGAAAAQLPTLMMAQRLSSQPDLQTVAEGKAEFRRGGMVIKADRLVYDSAEDLASATGQVRISRDGAVYSGPEMQLHVQRFEGWFLDPTFEFTQFGAGGHAERIDFLDGARSRATKAEYTSCRRDGPEEPAWVLRTDSVTLDLDANEGVAEGAVLRFLDTPILALPSLSFPLGDTRLSGWLPPTFDTDNRSGVEIAVPYYWNLAPNRDATITPRVITRRGLGLNGEYRYLEKDYKGTLNLDWLPYDRLTGRAREALQWTHEGALGGGLRVSTEGVRVSDDDWWKDFPSATRGLTPRLLPQRAALERPFALPDGEGLVYARAMRWQVLQDTSAVLVAPYERSPQIGVRLGGEAAGLVYGAEGEFNRFSLPGGELAQAGRSGGDRWHFLGDLSYPWREPGWFVVPKASVNAATYADSGLLPNTSRRVGRVIPTFSLDGGLELERTTEAFGRSFRQTLEPRLLYVLTPYRQQSQLPDYDAAAKDFNFNSIYSTNQFSGIDRVSDANLITAGVTTRFVDANSGAEALRLGLVQRYLFRPQRETAQADGTPDGPAVDKKLSDALLLGSTNLLPSWVLDGSVQYSPDTGRSVRTVIGMRYTPGPFQTVSATYRLTRGLTEQMELGWQWPVWSRQPASNRATGRSSSSASGNSCTGTLYAVGRLNYSLLDSRITDSIFGVEYDAGCWIGRIVAERLSTGSSQATTRLMLQLELVGLSRIGSNPLQVLKDNIPGYRLLRQDRSSASPTDDRLPDASNE